MTKMATQESADFTQGSYSRGRCLARYPGAAAVTRQTPTEFGQWQAFMGISEIESLLTRIGPAARLVCLNCLGVLEGEILFRLIPVLLLATALTACEKGDPVSTDTDGSCVSDADYFSDTVHGQVLSQHCIGCHNPQGVGRDSELVLKNSALPGYMEANQAMLTDLARLERDGTSILLLKPSGAIRHGGGTVIEVGDENYQILEGFLARIATPVRCEEDETKDPLKLEGVELNDPLETLRRAALILAGRLPRPDEIRRVQLGREGALGLVMNDLMTEPNFYIWLREVFNDRLLTDRYLGGNNGTELLDNTEYPNRYWYEAIEDNQRRRRLQSCATLGIARAPLELMLQVVREDRPFTDVLTASTTMVNACSAQSLGMGELFPNDPESYPREQFVEVALENRPHVGILATHAWLHRFPTTATNRNRHRARSFYETFLATDILRLASRPLDQASSGIHNPTMNDPQCSVCHANVDPVAGLFQNWDNRGRYSPPELGWHADMRPPGLGEEVPLPAGRSADSLRWLVEQTVSDVRFDLGVTRWVLEALTGRPALKPPEGSDPELQTAFEIEERQLKAIAAEFRANDHNLKTLIKGIVFSPLYRAEDISSAQQEGYSQLGTGHLLTPRQLDRRIQAVTGYPWRNYYGSTPYLLGSYRMLYGGIDSNGVTQRISQPNGLMASIARRMANEVACNVAARDFVLLARDRRLFPFVETSYEPETVDGFPIEGAIEGIRANIRYLHERILGERLSMNDPEIDHSYQLFYDTWLDGREAVRNGDESENLFGLCQARNNFNNREAIPAERRISSDRNYSIRAWQAVLTYLLSDYRFLYD